MIVNFRLAPSNHRDFSNRDVLDSGFCKSYLDVFVISGDSKLQRMVQQMCSVEIAGKIYKIIKK